MVVLAFAGIQLIPDGTLFIHIALILLMIWILNRTFFRPINKVLASRDKNSGGRNSDALEILKTVQDKHSGGRNSDALEILKTVQDKHIAYDSAIRESRNEGYLLVEKQRSEAIVKRQEEIDSVKNEVETLLISEKAAIAKQATKAKGEVAKEAQKLAEQISTNLLKA